VSPVSFLCRDGGRGVLPCVRVRSGARLISIELDGRRIFEGEVRKAPGHVSSVDACSEVILFTTDEAVLNAIESHDMAARANDDVTSQLVQQVMKTLEAARPRTAGGASPALARCRAQYYAP
jgi:hypothetical protein